MIGKRVRTRLVKKGVTRILCKLYFSAVLTGFYIWKQRKYESQYSRKSFLKEGNFCSLNYFVRLRLTKYRINKRYASSTPLIKMQKNGDLSTSQDLIKSAIKT